MKPRFVSTCAVEFCTTDDELESSERVNARDLTNSRNPLGTMSANLDLENDFNLCRPCTVIGSQHLEGDNNSDVSQNTSFVDV